MRQTHHITSDLSSWSSREVHQTNERVLHTSNKISQKISTFYFTYYIIITICKRNISLRDKLFHNYSYFLQESTKSLSPSTGIELLRVVQLESMPDYKYPNIDSGGYSHRKRWSRTRWRITSMKSKEENFESIVGGKHQKINSTFHSHRESKNPKISGSRRIEVRNWRSRRIEEIKVWRSRRLKKLKFEEVEDWRLKFWRLNPSLQLELSLGGYWHGYALRVPTD
jgi:hypothetical protein